MSYREVLFQAYALTVRKPILWLFGLVMLGGYNLSLINFFSIRNSDWQSWPLWPGDVLGSPAAGMAVVSVVLIATFIILNLVKIIFVVAMHSYIHPSGGKCMLCAMLARQDQANPDDMKPLPYFHWLANALIASGLTIVITLGVTFLLNLIMQTQGQANPAAMITNVLVGAVIACIVGTWNVFTTYFIVLYDLNFVDASSASIDLLVKQAKRVAEFAVILSVIYSLAVLVGNSFLRLWQHDPIGLAGAVNIVPAFIFLLWFAISNAFFNSAFLIFFDKLVKVKPAVKEASPAPTLS
jgi:hypothetical protein